MTEKRRRRWLQFSLRTLLVFVLLVSIGMSWFAVKMAKVRKQREAVEVIEKAGGFVVYGYSTGSSVPKWARAVFGKPFFFDTLGVDVGETEFGDDEAAYLKELTYIKYLALTGPQVTDIWLENLEGLTNLEWLCLNRTQVTPQGGESLRQSLPNLQMSFESHPPINSHQTNIRQ